jgi:hypothetical protein
MPDTHSVKWTSAWVEVIRGSGSFPNASCQVMTEASRRARLPTTQWSRIVAAGDREAAPEAPCALEFMHDHSSKIYKIQKDRNETPVVGPWNRIGSLRKFRIWPGVAEAGDC